jgi:hypothetical protein
MKQMSKPGILLLVAVVAAWVGLWGTPAFAQVTPGLAAQHQPPPAPVPHTGQTTEFEPGDDGDLQAGVPWPTPRFTVVTNLIQGLPFPNGTVRDNLTGLIWLRNANCEALGPNSGDGSAMWQDAVDAAKGLQSGSCGLTDGSVAGDWRLPNRNELLSLIDSGFFGPALSNAAGTAQWKEGDAFSGVSPSFYWSSTTMAAFPNFFEWVVALRTGGPFGSGEVNTNLVWPVRGGQ